MSFFFQRVVLDDASDLAGGDGDAAGCQLAGERFGLGMGCDHHLAENGNDLLGMESGRQQLTGLLGGDLRQVVLSLLKLAFSVLGIDGQVEDLSPGERSFGESLFLDESCQEIGDVGLESLLELLGGHSLRFVLDDCDDGVGEVSEFGEADVAVGPQPVLIELW